MTESESRRRIDIRLDVDAEGYPPFGVETLWAIELGQDQYRLDNIPFFAVGVSLGDIVVAPLADGRPTFSIVRQRGGHATLRVVVFETEAVSGVRAMLAGLGASTELSHLPRLISVDVPPEASLDEIRRVLAEGESVGRWTYEEADVPG